jgi:hypothetical protein
MKKLKHRTRRKDSRQGRTRPGQTIPEQRVPGNRAEARTWTHNPARVQIFAAYAGVWNGQQVLSMKPRLQSRYHPRS